MDDNRHPPYILLILVYIPLLYFSLQLAAIYTTEDTIFTLAEKYSDAVKADPLFISWSEDYSVRAIAIATAVYLLIAFYIFTAQKPTMPGQEFGAARWARPREINRKYKDKEESYNRIYSQRVRVSMDPQKTGMSNNALVIGSSGTGKSFYLLTPNIYKANTDTHYPGSFVFTDPKSELLKRNGEFLKSRGYAVKVLDLRSEGMANSDGYNPFDYIRNENDVDKLITNLIDNTTRKGSTASEPFWENSEIMLLEALFLYVWMEGDRYGYAKNMNSVLDILATAEVPSEAERERHVKSPLDEMFDQLCEDTADREDGGVHHPAYLKYKKCFVGATDTIRSIVLSVNVRLARFENRNLRRILEKDELELDRMGTDRHTALFCVIPDTDTTYNCIAGMLYTQLFQELCDIADHRGVGGRLPIPVTFWLDEFCNIVMPDNFNHLYTTIRSRDISAVVIIQGLSQLKELYKDSWDQIVGNADVTVYLGGNEDTTAEHISKRLGKSTIWKNSHSKSYGKMGGGSSSEDKVGRELMMPDEVKRLKNNKCIVFVRGEHPVKDWKFNTRRLKEYKEAMELGEYVHVRVPPEQRARPLTDEELEAVLSSGEVRHDAPDPGDSEWTMDISGLALDEILHIPGFKLTEEELDEVLEGMDHGLPDELIKSYILCGDAQKMRAQRKTMEVLLKGGEAEQEEE
ncbi:MAG: type IV secretory system conjugative DNA transfer family protein [Lachnospiraceae bacterium]|nr:type IV secretory system conjugative DNA transfer family protein [Lachnospiraceae bacterium]